jgi:RNA polymerase sigma factor (TIGR02999 family)
VVSGTVKAQHGPESRHSVAAPHPERHVSDRLVALRRIPPAANLMSNAEQITQLLLQLRGGDPDAADRLFAAVYPELRRMAHRHLQGERPGHTLGTTGLVHETYVRLVDLRRVEWQDRGHFFRVASAAMRRILVDYARKHRAARRGGGLRAELLEDRIPAAERGELVLALDEALDRLTALSQRLGHVVECRFFGGLTEEETADALGVTTRTVQRDWAKARAWLYAELRDAPATGAAG